jgi:hypothetical protein
MTDAEDILKLLLEADEGDDEETIKDILGNDYLEPPDPSPSGTVERFDRWANIGIGSRSFCISYLTPVAVYTSGEDVRLTDKNWSSSTARHIKKWLAHIGCINGRETWAQVQEMFPTMPQQELIDLFNQEARTVQWTKRQAKTATSFRQPEYGLKSSGDEHIRVDPYQSPNE